MAEAVPLSSSEPRAVLLIEDNDGDVRRLRSPPGPARKRRRSPGTARDSPGEARFGGLIASLDRPEPIGHEIETDGCEIPRQGQVESACPVAVDLGIRGADAFVSQKAGIVY